MGTYTTQTVPYGDDQSPGGDRCGGAVASCRDERVAEQRDHETGIPVGQYTVEFSDVAGWTKPANQTVTINKGQTTSATGTYTPRASNPVNPAEGTIGTDFTITGSGFGTKKGKVSIGNTSVTVLEWSDVLISARLGKALAPGVYDVTILPSEPKGSSAIIHNDAFVVKPVEIDSIDRDDGTAWDQITIQGRFFGTKKGKLYLEYDEGGNPVRKNCKVLRWAMDSASGDGEIVFVVPKMLPKVCDVVVVPSGALSEIDGQVGFTVKAPEIIEVTPNAGTPEDEITIHGYFFGTKKPKVYLGYNMNGKPKKKSCLVVTWTVVDPSTGEGDVVFKVPTGLAPGTYDASHHE